jgi:hypothetical protein
MIPLTRNEIRRLFTGLSQQQPAPASQLHWSRWRRHHQAVAQACHYRRRSPAPARLRSVAGVLIGVMYRNEDSVTRQIPTWSLYASGAPPVLATDSPGNSKAEEKCPLLVK